MLSELCDQCEEKWPEDTVIYAEGHYFCNEICQQLFLNDIILSEGGDLS